jgi:hypothetical protein
MTQSNKLPAVCRHCKTTKWNDDYTPAVIPKKTILDYVRELTTAQRMTLFESFELCCGMNRGACICEVETVAVKPIASPVIAPAGMNDAMARFMAKLDSEPIIEQIEETWELTNDKATLNDDGRWYRYQYLTANPKKRRLVMVDEENYTDVIKIIGQ